MKQNHTNPAIAHMDVAQDEMATYAMLVNRAQLSLTESMQAFERANENSRASDCPTPQQITQKLRQQYAALKNLTAAIVETLAAPTLSRMIATAPKQIPQLITLLDCLPEEERDLLAVALITLLKVEGEDLSIVKEQTFLAASILYVIGKRAIPTLEEKNSFSN